MTWFSLPPLRTGAPPPFVDKAGVEAWLATQPLANAVLMQGELADRLESLNTWKIAPAERYRLLEALRKTVAAIEVESVKRYEHRPLPLSAVEQKALDASCRLWRELTTGYLHCLRACLDGDASVAEDAAKICHRAMSAARLEQLSRYRGGVAIPGNWWRKLHALLASAEQLGVEQATVSDRLLTETRESTVSGHYAMAILLHLCRPGELSRGQFAAVIRWLARWREQASVHASMHEIGKARCVVVDLSADAPLHYGETAPAMPRWLLLDPILGKLKGRIKSLQDGESPEALKLGAGLPADACIALMQTLYGNLQNPPPPLPAPRDNARSVGVAGSVESAYRLLGGTALADEGAPSSVSTRREHEQIAIFGRVVRPDAAAVGEVATESWQVLLETTGEMSLRRPPGGAGEPRLSCRSLVGVRDVGGCRLGVIRSVVQLEDGSLHALLRLLPGHGLAMLALGHEKATNRTLRLPAIFLAAVPGAATPASVIVPGGVVGRLSRLEIGDLPDGLRLGDAIDRGANFERLRCA
ncbi:MAG TPA: hypothetical protein VFY24_08920 [Azospira sp.]|nr:hypothetical protein [Azospira sp.]